MLDEAGPWASALRPIAEIALVTTYGGWLATINVLNRDGCRALSGFNFWACLPALTFVSVARTGVTIDIVPLAVNILFLSMGLGLLAGKFLVKQFGISQAKTPIILALMAFRNIGNLPLVLIPSTCRTEFFLSRFESVEACTARGNTYISYNIATIAFVQFTIVHHLFENVENSDADKDERDRWHWMSWVSWMRHLLPPPAAGAMMGAIVSSIPALKQLVTQSFLADGADILAQASVGSTIPLLGATLYNEQHSASGQDPHEQFSTKFIACLVGLQTVIMPWFSSLLFLISQRVVYLAIGGSSDPLMLFVGVTASSTPPAIVLLSLAIMYRVSPKDVAQILLILYIAAAVVFPMNVAGFLRVLSIVS